jgi:membrane fusion protein (multidrug efflux system)
MLAMSAIAAAAAPVEVVLEPVRAMTVSAPVDGVLAKVAVEEGDPVNPGDLLIAFEHGEENLQVERAAEVLRKREFDFRGAQQLFTENMTSETETLEKEIELKVARIDHAQAVERRDRRIVRAVQPGTIVERHHVAGEYVERGEPLLAMVDQSELDARFYVRPEVGLKLQGGTTAWLHVPQVKATRRCHIVFIDPQVDPSSGLMRGRARVDNTDGAIKPGLRGWLSLTETEPTQWP